ncbi:hypothetical protein EDB84DRAFT_1434340 [Lactarius hengduanensis]|nr:hypothetical protein EDB84DRAFT_1434340 [Lactarius hengduanensis]
MGISGSLHERRKDVTTISGKLRAERQTEDANILVLAHRYYCTKKMWATKEVTHPKTGTNYSTIRKQKTPSPTGHRQYVVPEPGEKINDNATEAAPDQWISWHLPYCAAPAQRCGTFALGRPLRPLGDTSNIPLHPPEVRRKEGVVILYNSALSRLKICMIYAVVKSSVVVRHSVAVHTGGWRSMSHGHWTKGYSSTGVARDVAFGTL